MRRTVVLAVALSLAAACSNDGAKGVFGAGGDSGLGGLEGGGLNGGGLNGSGADGSADGDVIGLPQCETRTLSTDRATPNMLIVLDRSTSMTDNDDNTDRWSGSRDAVTTVVEELEDRIRFGLMTFPNGGGGGFDDFFGGGGGQCAAGDLDVPLATMNADAIDSTLSGMNNQGYTPTAQTLEAAREVMAEQQSETVGEFALPQYVMLVTDGDPNCFSDQVTGDPEAQQASIQAVEDLTSDGVATYVIGFQTAGSDFAGVLDDMADAGGTGAMQHRSVSSGEELLDEFRRIAGAAVSCSFVLAQPADWQRVTITVDGQPTDFGEDWEMRDDNQTVDLLGSTCDALRSGTATVEAVVNCDIVNVI